MGDLPNNVFASDTNSAVPNIAKSLIVALLAILASRYLGVGEESSASADSKPGSGTASTPQAPASILDGFGALIKQFQEKGLGDTIETRINPGATEEVRWRSG